jgi:lactoylglutathione lyase
MARPIHVMIRVLDEARSVAFYRDALGLEAADRFGFDDFTLVYLKSADAPFELELTINHGRTEPYAPGDGYGHLAVVVDDLEGEHARLAGAGIAAGPIREMQRDGALLARFFFLADPDGYRIEMLQSHGRYR